MYTTSLTGWLFYSSITWPGGNAVPSDKKVNMIESK